MGLILTIIVVLVLVGLALWLIQSAPFPQPVPWALSALVILLAIIFIGHRAGLF